MTIHVKFIDKWVCCWRFNTFNYIFTEVNLNFYKVELEFAVGQAARAQLQIRLIDEILSNTLCLVWHCSAAKAMC